MKNFVRSNVFLTAVEKAALKRIARRRKVSAATVLREFLDKALNLTPGVTEHSHVSGARSGK